MSYQKYKDIDLNKDSLTHSAGWLLLLEAPAELELVLGSSAIPPPSRNMVTAISKLLLQASSICCPTLSVAPVGNPREHSQTNRESKKTLYSQVQSLCSDVANQLINTIHQYKPYFPYLIVFARRIRKERMDHYEPMTLTVTVSNL